MSKKRKTRVQKVKAATRHDFTRNTEPETPTYSITTIAPDKLAKKEEASTLKTFEAIAQKDIAYLKHDITSITAASGIIIAFDILFFVLLNFGIIHLNFLGY